MISDFPGASYDAWKTCCPDYDWEEPQFECFECMDTGYLDADDDDGEPAEPCPYCYQEVTLDDLEMLYVEEFG